MSDVGDLVVRFAADLSNLTSGIDNAKSQINSVGTATEAAAAKVAGASSEIEGSMSGVAESADRASGGFLSGIGNMAGSLLDFGAKIGMTIFSMQAMWQTGVSLAQSLLGPAISAETVTTALTTLDGSAKAAGDEMSKLNQFAAKTPFKTLEIDQAAEELQGFGTSAADVVPEITAIGDALGSVGRDTPAELDSVVQIFGKIRTEGKITAMTMNELAVHGINGWQALADATGKTIPQVKEMVAKGLLPANDAINDLTKGIEMNPLYKGGMARAAGTFTGLLSTLQSNWDQVISAFGTPIIKALEGDLNNLGNVLASPGFQQFAGSVGQGVVNVFTSIGKTVGPLLADLAPVGGFIEHLAGSFQSLGKGSAGSGFLSSLSTGFKDVQSIVGGALTDDFKFFMATIQDLGKWWQSTMLPAISAAMPGFEHLGSVLATTVAPAFAKLWAVGQQLARDVIGPATKEFEFMEPILVRVAGFLADKLGGALQVVTPDIVSAAQAVGQFASDIESRAQPIVEQLSAGLKIFLDWIGPYWPSIWRGISDSFAMSWSIIKGTFQIAWALFSGSWKILLDLLSGNWKQAWTDIQDTFKGIWAGIATIAQGAFGPIWGSIKAGINGVIDLINGFINGVDSIHVNVPGVGNVGFSIPDIPYLATGGFVPPGGVAVAGDAGPELVFGGASGATVLSHAASQAALGGGRQDIHVHVYLDGQEITNQVGQNIVNMIRSGYPIGAVA